MQGPGPQEEQLLDHPALQTRACLSHPAAALGSSPDDQNSREYMVTKSVPCAHISPLPSLSAYMKCNLT